MFLRMTFATLARLNHAITCVNIIGASKCNISPSWLCKCKMTSSFKECERLSWAERCNMNRAWFEISKGRGHMIISLLKG